MHKPGPAPAFIRDGVAYHRHLPVMQPYSLDTPPEGAIACGNCAFFCPVGKRGFADTAPERLPERLNKLYEALVHGTGRPDHEADWPMVFRRFLAGVGYCVAHAPVPGEVGAAGLSHRSWRCGAFARGGDD